MFPAHQSSSIGSCANVTSIEKEERALHYTSLKELKANRKTSGEKKRVIEKVQM